MNEGIEKVRSGDLYALLALCTKEDLDPLVTAILGRLSNFLDIDENYKRFKPDHTKYHRVIGDEIRLFGGNSLRNIARGNEGPPYAEIVVDACKKLGIPYRDGDTLKNEANLLDIFVEQRWSSLSAVEREKLAEEARKAALGKTSDVSAAGVAAAAFVVSRIAFGPAALVALGFNMLDPAFKVTVPCVLHIAYLRRRILDEWREPVAASVSAVLSAPAETALALRSAALSITGAEGQPVLSLARIPEPAGGTWHEIGSSDDGISRLNPLLQAVPSLTIAREVATRNYMEIVTNGDRLLQTKEGVLKAVTVGADNKFTGIADVLQPARLAAMVNVSALIQVASIALAQKHLADISQKLSEIRQGVDAIRKHQKDERHSRVTGSIRYCEQLAASVLAGDLSAEVLQQIESQENELLRIQDHVMKDIRTAVDGIRSVKDDEWFGSDGIRRAIKEQQNLLVELYRELILCIRARACAWQLLCVFPGREKRKEIRRRDIQRSIDGLDTCGEMLTKTDKLLRKKIHEISSRWNRSSTVNERKLTLLQANETLLADVAMCRSGVLKDLGAADEMLTAMKRPVAMAVRIEDGRIVAIRAL